MSHEPILDGANRTSALRMNAKFPTVCDSHWRAMFRDFHAAGGLAGNVAWRQIQDRLSRGDESAASNRDDKATMNATRDPLSPETKNAGAR